MEKKGKIFKTFVIIFAFVVFISMVAGNNFFLN